jgi:putative ABC transport system permease protein
MGIPVLRGRAFTDADRAGAPPVALVDEAFAKRAWGAEDPIGRRIGLGDHPFATVVGVVGEVRHRGLDVPGGLQVYVPAAQWPDGGAVLVVRCAGDPAATLAAVRAAVRSVDPDQPITRASTLHAVVAEAAGARRFAMLLLLGFAGLAVLLAAVGIYGVVSGYVARRTREIGIRMALGATRRSILSLVTGRAFLRTLAGLAVGAAGALAEGRAMRGLLFEVPPADAASLLLGAVGVLAVAAAASLWPARRATRVDPIVALKEE